MLGPCPLVGTSLRPVGLKDDLARRTILLSHFPLFLASGLPLLDSGMTARAVPVRRASSCPFIFTGPEPCPQEGKIARRT